MKREEPLLLDESGRLVLHFEIHVKDEPAAAAEWRRRGEGGFAVFLWCFGVFTWGV